MIREMCDGLQSVRKPGQTILVFNCVYGSEIGVFGLKNASIHTDDADKRGSSRIKPKKISVNPLHQRHPRSITPYTDLNPF